jgi:hypothetical protein
MACQFNYKGRNYTEEQAKPIASYHYLVEEALLETTNFKKEGSKLIINSIEDFGDTPVVTTIPLDVVNKSIIDVNTKYGAGSTVATLQDNTVNIDVNPIADKILESGMQNLIQEDTGLEETVTLRKAYNLEGTDEETMEGYQAKADLMEARFNELGITSHVIMDGDLNASGELLGTDSKRYKDMVEDGTINDGDAVIIVNPRQLFTDTVFHEYGHIFIDMLGGMNNPRIKYAYSKIKNSPLALQVMEQYPELSGDALAKEIMATAIGKEATSIYDGVNNDDKNFIQKFIEWVRNGIRDLLGLPTSTVKDLANEVLGNVDVDTNELTGTLATGSQFLKGTKEKREARRTKILDNAEATVKKIKTRLNNTYAQVANSEDVVKKEFKLKVKELQNQLKLLEKNSNLAAIQGYLDQLDKVGGSLDEALGVLQKQINDGKKPNVSFELLSQLKLFKSLFSIINEVETSATSGYFENEFKAEGWSDVDSNALKDLVTKVSALHKAINNKEISVGRVHLSYKMAEYSNRETVLRRLELESELKASNPKQSNESLKDYNKRIRGLVNENISSELEQLKKDEQLSILEKLQNAPADLTEFGMWMSDEKDLNSTIIQIASKLLDESDLLRDQKMTAMKMQAYQIFKKFDKETSGQSAKEKYKGIYKEGSDGRLYITTEYNPEWFIQRKALLDKVTKASEADNTEEYNKALEALKTWDKANSEFYTEGIQKLKKPNSKWKDKDYANLMSKPDSGRAQMLKFLNEYSITNSKLLHGNASLVKQMSSSKEVFILAPSVGKSFFEKAVDGNYAKNTKDSFERFYKTKADDEDLVGDTANLDIEKRSLKVMADAEGNSRHGVPIHFRGAIDRDTQSYDLMSSILMDHYMALNYHYKSGLQVELELMKDVVNEKKFAQTTGFSKKPLNNSLNRDEDEPLQPIIGKNSKELKALTSIIDNRLYGIKNINTEYAKAVSSVMSWTASSMLVFNMPSAVTNMLQGNLYNFFEAHSGQFFNRQNLVRGTKHFMTDLSRSLDDMGRAVQTSKTHVLTEFFNIQGEFKSISNKFIENSRFKAMAKKSTGFAFSQMGEFYMHGTLMYSILDSIKIRNANNQFIDKNGKVVTEDKAMTLAEALDVSKDGTITLNPHAKKTNFGNADLSLDLKKDKGLLEVKQLINKIAHDLHGNYNDDIQNMAQRTIHGKLFFMLRKWMVPGFNKRWRGAVTAFTNKEDLREDVDMYYSEDLQSFQEGYYTTGVRFLKNLITDLKTMGMLASYKQNLEGLTEVELANMRRFSIEVASILITLASGYLLKALAEGMPEDEIERETLFHLTYYTRRIYSETTFFSNPVEALKILQNPAASTNYLFKVIKFGGQVLEDGYGITFGDGPEIYERGKFKGDPKLWKRTGDLLPGVNQYYRDIEESTSWLFNLY